MQLTNKEFDALIAHAMDDLPKEYIANLNNVAITYADDPTPEQLAKNNVGPGMILLGLYEGIPLTERGAGYNFVLPDKITLFKNPILSVTGTRERLYQQIKRTLWHEIAHHYGLNHDRIHALHKDHEN